MEVKREKPIEEVLDEHNISWSYGDKDKVLKTLNMLKEFIEDNWVDDNHDKVWIVTYYDVTYGELESIVTCFNNKENAMKYYEYILDRHDIVSIDECEVYTEFKVWDL